AITIGATVWVGTAACVGAAACTGVAGVLSWVRSAARQPTPDTSRTVRMTARITSGRASYATLAAVEEREHRQRAGRQQSYAHRGRLQRGDEQRHGRRGVNRLGGRQLAGGRGASHHLVDVERDVLDVTTDHQFAVVPRGSERKEQPRVQAAGSVTLYELEWNTEALCPIAVRLHDDRLGGRRERYRRVAGD